jgi:peptide/nickel transport system substrate-binding protein
MNHRLLRFFSVLVILALALAGCTTPVAPGAETGAPAEAGSAPPAAPGQLPRNETLYMAGLQWGPFITFNVLAPNQTWPTNGPSMLMFEALFAFNVATGEIDPLLAKELTFVDDSTMEITLQDGTTWQDGTPLTVDDVIFTFELAKTHDDLRYSLFWDYVTEMVATGDRTFQIKLNPEQLNIGQVKFWLHNERIIPKHIWEARAAGDTPLSQFVDENPVGSGPYKLLNYTSERIALERYEEYWGKEVFGTPAPRYVVHPIFDSNDAGNLAFQQGTVDLSQQFAPQIWQMWEEKGLPVGTWFTESPYHIPGNIPLLHINVHRPGLDNVLVRRALAYSINYAQIAETAMSRYSIPVQPSLVIPSGGEEKFYDAEQVAELGWEYNPERARQILEEELGATKGSDGIYVLPDGTRLGPYKVLAVYGWTDWMTAVELVAQSATEAGIDVTTEFPEQPVLVSQRNAGDFDMLIFTYQGASAASPWRRYREALDIRGVPPMGENAFWNWNRFEHPEVAELLDQAAAATDPEVQAQLYSQLDRIFLENIPVIPLMYRPLEFYEYNETVWSGFPNAENPSAAPMFQSAGVQILYQIGPAD